MVLFLLRMFDEMNLLRWMENQELMKTMHDVEWLGTKQVPAGVWPEAPQQNTLSDGRPDAGLKLDFRKVHLETVLDHLHKSAGLIIHITSNVQTEATVDLCHDRPVTTSEALMLLKKVLVGIGCTLVQKGPIFSVIRSQDVKKHYIPLPAV